MNDDNLCLVMELVEGDDLALLIQEYGRLEPRFVQMVVRQIVDALAYLHSEGIFHGDLKPQNIMLTKDLTVKLVDFGSSNFFRETNKNREVMASIEKFASRLKGEQPDDFNGTAHYASPELIDQGANQWTDDLWSLGVLAYQMLTARLPFNAETEHLVFGQIEKLDFDSRPVGLSASAASFCRDLLQKSKNRLGCGKHGFDPQAILNHRFMTENMLEKKSFPRVRFRRGREIDRITSFTYGVPKIGRELLKDYVLDQVWWLIPRKRVLVLKSNRRLSVWNENESTLIREIHIDEIQKLTIRGSTVLEILINGGETILFELLSSLAKQWLDQIVSIS